MGTAKAFPLPPPPPAPAPPCPPCRPNALLRVPHLARLLVYFGCLAFQIAVSATNFPALFFRNLFLLLAMLNVSHNCHRLVIRLDAMRLQYSHRKSKHLAGALADNETHIQNAHKTNNNKLKHKKHIVANNDVTYK